MGVLVPKIKNVSHKQFMKKNGAFVRNVHIKLLSRLTIILVCIIVQENNVYNRAWLLEVVKKCCDNFLKTFLVNII